MYRCPYTLRLKQYKFIICGKLIEGKTLKEHANQCMCGYQYLCQRTKQMEHTQGAEKCTIRQSS